MPSIILKGSPKTNKVTITVNGVKGPSCVNEIQKIIEMSGSEARVRTQENTAEYDEVPSETAPEREIQ